MAEKHKKGYVATLPTLWATSDLVPRFEAEVANLPTLWATSDFAPRVKCGVFHLFV